MTCALYRDKTGSDGEDGEATISSSDEQCMLHLFTCKIAMNSQMALGHGRCLHLIPSPSVHNQFLLLVKGSNSQQHCYFTYHSGLAYTTNYLLTVTVSQKG